MSEEASLASFMVKTLGSPIFLARKNRLTLVTLGIEALGLSSPKTNDLVMAVGSSLPAQYDLASLGQSDLVQKALKVKNTPQCQW